MSTNNNEKLEGEELAAYIAARFPNPEEAARSADREAALEAEACREYQAEQETEDLKRELHALNKEMLALIKEVKAERAQDSAKHPAICQALKQTIKSALRKRTKIIELIEALEDNYWLAVENW